MIDKTTVFITTQRAFPLGYQGENEAREIVFPQPEELLVENWMLLHQRALDKEPYPVPLEKRDGALVWLVTSGDTAIPGNGQAELTCIDGAGAVLKSRIYSTNVTKALDGGGEIPDPVEPWYQKILEEIDVKIADGLGVVENGYY